MDAELQVLHLLKKRETWLKSAIFASLRATLLNEQMEKYRRKHSE